MHMEELFNDEKGVRPTMEGEFVGPEILENEVRQAPKKLKREKAEECDAVVTERLEAAGDYDITKVTKFMMLEKFLRK